MILTPKPLQFRGLWVRIIFVISSASQLVFVYLCFFYHICDFICKPICIQVVSYENEVRSGARLSDYDILASNGVIHAIDSVI